MMNSLDKTVERLVVAGGTADERQEILRSAANALSERGYLVLRAPNVSQELRQAGLTAETLGSPAALAAAGLDLQLAQEYALLRAARIAPAAKVLLLCDGGAMDGRRLLTENDGWDQLLGTLGVPEVLLRDSYGAVFCLAPEAADSWAGHPHLRVVSSGEAEQLTAEILAFLGDPGPVEIERRFLIRMPDPAWLSARRGCRPVNVEQAYCQNAAGETYRLRQRGANSGYIYFVTVKHGYGAKRTEIERRITAAEYQQLLAQAVGEVRWIRKTRWCLVYQGRYLEIDVYPFWQDKAILEAELLHEADAVEIPPEITVIQEITGDPDYSNYALARPETATPDGTREV